MPIAMTDKDNNRYYLHYDQVGSLRAISDKDHNIIKEITYDTYGNIINDTNPDLKVPFGFAGGLYDSDTKLVHFGYREYDSFTGKWTAKDPIGFQGGDSNLYGYVLGDPVGLVDPEGLKSFSECLVECMAKQLGFGDIASLGCGLSGLPIIKKPFGGNGNGATGYTSPLSKALSSNKLKKYNELKMPINPFRSKGSRQWWAPTWKNWHSRTSRLGRFLTRWIPGIGWGFLAYDGIKIGICTKNCMENTCE